MKQKAKKTMYIMIAGLVLYSDYSKVPFAIVERYSTPHKFPWEDMNFERVYYRFAPLQWLAGKNKVGRDEEYRCRECIEHDSCPAAETGVCYPCSYYKQKK